MLRISSRLRMLLTVKYVQAWVDELLAFLAAMECSAARAPDFTGPVLSYAYGVV